MIFPGAVLLKIPCAYRLPRILLKCRLWFSSSGVRPKHLHSTSSLVLLKLVHGPCFVYQRAGVLDRKEKGKLQAWLANLLIWLQWKERLEESMATLLVIQWLPSGVHSPISVLELDLNILTFFFFKARWGREENGIGTSLPSNVFNYKKDNMRFISAFLFFFPLLINPWLTSVSFLLNILYFLLFISAL